MNKNLTILVVDDFSTMRRIIKKILKGMGLEKIIEADNGQKAWEILNSQDIDLVICDWNMPAMTGMELLEKVRGHQATANLPFIMVTAEGKDKMTVAKGKENLTDYIGKPFKAGELEEKIKGMIE